MSFTSEALKDPAGEVDRILAKFAQKGVSSSNLPVLQLDIDKQMRARNHGFPKHMYHATLLPQIVLNPDQEAGIRELGYSDQHIPRRWPTFVFRRNMDPKFKDDDFIESKVVNSPDAFSALHQQRIPDTVLGKWRIELSEIEPLPEKSREDPKVTIARLEGRLEGNPEKNQKQAKTA